MISVSLVIISLGVRRACFCVHRFIFLRVKFLQGFGTVTLYCGIFFTVSDVRHVAEPHGSFALVYPSEVNLSP